MWKTEDRRPKTEVKPAWFLLFALLLVSCFVLAQEPTPPKKQKTAYFDNPAWLFSINYNAQWPFGNMAERFGFNNQIGLMISRKFKNNWHFGAEGSFLFGSDVRETSVLYAISNPQGLFITQDGVLTPVKLQQRGFTLKVNIAKTIPVSTKYPDAGILLMTGFGFLQHKIFLDVREDKLPQLDKTYRKGYDRLSNGPLLSQFIGGIFVDRKIFASFYGGFQFEVGFTKCRRAYQFDLMGTDNRNRIDMFMGLRVGYILPVFTRSDNVEYYK